jgi:hypothetical protein
MMHMHAGVSVRGVVLAVLASPLQADSIDDLVANSDIIYVHCV